ncbi:MAG: hypothetical protein WDM90_22635 [Ferruginibacter sp.]
MKKIFTIVALTVFVWSCSHKATPTAAKTPAATASVAATPVVPPPAKPETVVPPVPAVDNSAVTQGQTTYTAKCGRCHGLKTTTDFTAERWVGLVESMAPKARLDATEKANVLAYVQANAKK